jgi:hypothetical protein
MKNELSLIEASELSLVESNSLNAKQLDIILKKTPAQYVKKRPAKGGGQWDYVTGGYVKKCLNLMFGWDWDFEIIEQQVLHGEAIVKGKLTCRSNGKTIVKMQFGNKDIVCRKNTEIPLSIGNDLKAAATDCLKKCAAEIGIAADIYNKEDFREIRVNTKEIEVDELRELFELKKDGLPQVDIDRIEQIINNKEINSYKKTFKKLQAL